MSSSVQEESVGSQIISAFSKIVGFIVAFGVVLAYQVFASTFGIAGLLILLTCVIGALIAVENS